VWNALKARLLAWVGLPLQEVAQAPSTRDIESWNAGAAHFTLGIQQPRRQGRRKFEERVKEKRFTSVSHILLH
jgi:hypothetical protein